MRAARKIAPAVKSQAQIFNETFFVNRKIEWFDKQGVFLIDENKRAVIQISYFGHQNHYSGYEVQIIHKNTGQIASKSFKFDSYMEKTDRTDNRNDYPLGGNTCFYAWASSGDFKWYIATPTETAVKRVSDRIFEYIEMWR